MKPIIGLCAILLTMTCFIGCKKDKPAEPEKEIKILSFIPNHGKSGTVVKISGMNFNTTASRNEVSFNGKSATVLAATENELMVRVSPQTATGKITVASGNQTATSTEDFTIDQPLPQDLAFAPLYGPATTEITITADNITANAMVLADNNNVTVISQNQFEVKFKLPANVAPGEHALSIQTAGKTWQLGKFTVLEPGAAATWVKLSDGHPFIMYHNAVSFLLRHQIFWGFTKLNNETNDAFFTALYNTPELNVIDWTRLAYTGTIVGGGIKPAADAVAVVHNEKVYFGTGFTNQLNNQWWLFNESGAVTRLTDYPEPTAGALSFVLNGHIYVGFGGLNKKLYQFTPEENSGMGSWKTVFTANTFDFNKGAAFVIGNAAYLGRAVNTANGPRTAFYKFTEPATLTPVTNFPEEVPAPVTPSFVLDNKGYLVAGRNIWQYTPDAGGGTWLQVLASASGPAIQYTAVTEGKAFGWNDYGALYQLALQ